MKKELMIILSTSFSLLYPTITKFEDCFTSLENNITSLKSTLSPKDKVVCIYLSITDKSRIKYLGNQTGTPWCSAFCDQEVLETAASLIKTYPELQTIENACGYLFKYDTSLQGILSDYVICPTQS